MTTESKSLAYTRAHRHATATTSTEIGNEAHYSTSTWTDANLRPREKSILQCLLTDVKLRNMVPLFEWKKTLGAIPNSFTLNDPLGSYKVEVGLIRGGTGILTVAVEIPQNGEDDQSILYAWAEGQGVTFKVTARFDPSKETSADPTPKLATYSYTCYPAYSMPPASSDPAAGSRSYEG